MTLIALAFNTVIYIRVDVAENKRRPYLIMPVGNIGKQLYWVIVAHFLPSTCLYSLPYMSNDSLTVQRLQKSAS